MMKKVCERLLGYLYGVGGVEHTTDWTVMSALCHVCHKSDTFVRLTSGKTAIMTGKRNKTEGLNCDSASESRQTDKTGTKLWNANASINIDEMHAMEASGDTYT